MDDPASWKEKEMLVASSITMIIILFDNDAMFWFIDIFSSSF